MSDDEQCEYPGCDYDQDDMHVYGFTVDGLIEHERRYCPDHSPTSEVIDP